MHPDPGPAADMNDDAPGTRDLEAGMRPSTAGSFIPIATVAVALLFVFNSAGLVRWTENLPPSRFNTFLSDAANVWHDAMNAAGPARLFEIVKEAIEVDLR
jgi:hypothetical protein